MMPSGGAHLGLGQQLLLEQLRHLARPQERLKRHEALALGRQALELGLEGVPPLGRHRLGCGRLGGRGRCRENQARRRRRLRIAIAGRWV